MMGSHHRLLALVDHDAPYRPPGPERSRLFLDS